ncbi:PQQ-dependent sugar dehydrogenase [Sphingomonas changnyeongensis]|uniref:PQQ-dependent sugar dehydrogenase n=1 Tax=Sphingomonas changnyeongensis TaxID=2698679 RepID=A0A7Z2S8A7_9SPHN|nr:PQQ-dependent sugar dehydrogenase [Sphingomonas changnyeongensis]QHL91216.1 PQQ-dependent sugar dehydrogenase [Sphingomonas changnyeongensis]
MEFMPDGRLLVTEKAGRLRVLTSAGTIVANVAGVPTVDFIESQGGLLDVELHPQFQSNRTIYLSYVEGDSTARGIAVARAVIDLQSYRLTDVRVIWRQDPKVAADGGYGGRLLFAQDGTLFIAAGDRPVGVDASETATTLGKIIRLRDDGSIPADNPFVTTAGARPEIWSTGHRNPYGLAFDLSGRLWQNEMGPKGGDELNLIQPGRSYGWPNVSEGIRYDDVPIPRHATAPQYVAPAISWTPSIAPSSMIVYSGSLFVGWRGQAIITGLVSRGLVRVQLDGTTASEVQRIPLGQRIREVKEAADGSLWVLEDHPGGRLLRLTPA